jgi:hypothetical protein
MRGAPPSSSLSSSTNPFASDFVAPGGSSAPSASDDDDFDHVGSSVGGSVRGRGGGGGTPSMSGKELNDRFAMLVDRYRALKEKSNLLKVSDTVRKRLTTS